MMALTLDHGVCGKFLDEAPFLIIVKIKMERIDDRDEKKKGEQ